MAGSRIGSLARAAGLAAVLVLGAATGGSARVDDTYESLRAEAFEAAQWAIASDAADALAKVSARFAQGDDAIGRLAEGREALITRRDRLEHEIERLYALDDEASRQRRETARAEYDQTLDRLRTVDAEIETRFPAYSELTSPQALTVEETQGLLREDEGLLLVLVNPEAAYVWALTRDRVEWARSESLGQEEMAAAVARLRASLTTAAARGQPYIDPSLLQDQTDTAFDRAEAHRIYSELIAPVEDVFRGRSTLITVTSGDLSALPLALLPTEAPDGADDSAAALAATPWLIDRYALAALPSVSSLTALRCHLVSDPALRSPGCPPAPAGPAPQAAAGERIELVAFGAPVLAGHAVGAARGAPPAGDLMGDGPLADVERLRALPALPGSRAELEALQSRYPRSLVRMGEAATETAVRQTDREALSRARFVVFSTHGLLAGSDQAEPGLVLTPPSIGTAEDDGYLSASEAAELRLSADFVVLSACNTAASDGQPGGEGLSGLARAFFYAGARSLVVSHWEVSDAATTELMTRTFAALDDADIGERARALREGMRAVRDNPRWAHPAYWAPFTLVGEPG
ncbi:CHAT domain-containing protein [Brevundimonas abyssalis]|uniref:CHAT domain-containing protein n=1 Tax=Brevundimonas abyssalis TaxID=1125965 RepID=UPI0009DF2A2B|nr:CHAT domain-containing protein [Brevundimonas abyssalis]